MLLRIFQKNMLNKYRACDIYDYIFLTNKLLLMLIKIEI